MQKFQIGYIGKKNIKRIDKEISEFSKSVKERFSADRIYTGKKII